MLIVIPLYSRSGQISNNNNYYYFYKMSVKKDVLKVGTLLLFSHNLIEKGRHLKHQLYNLGQHETCCLKMNVLITIFHLPTAETISNAKLWSYFNYIMVVNIL